MNRRKLVVGSVLGVGLIAGGILIAQGPPPPPENVEASRHPHMAAAQHHIREAFDEMGQAQRSNDYDMHGHAEKARNLMIQASAEIKMAAEDANRH